MKHKYQHNKCLDNHFFFAAYFLAFYSCSCCSASFMISLCFFQSIVPKSISKLMLSKLQDCIASQLYFVLFGSWGTFFYGSILLFNKYYILHKLLTHTSQYANSLFRIVQNQYTQIPYHTYIQGKTNLKFKMIEENQNPSELLNDSRTVTSRVGTRKRNQSKLSQYETSLINFTKNQKSGLEKINPKGIVADAIYVSFSGIIQSAQLFLRENQDFQISYQIIVGQQWHDQTPDVKDLEGISPFCQAKDGIIHFSLNFDCLLSCVYIQSWPQLIMTIKGFNPNGQIITKGYAQIHLPVESGQKIKETNIFSIHREERWYQRLFRFFQPNPLTLDQKDFQRIIAKGEGREVQKIRTIGKIRIRTQTLKRNFGKFGYK